MISDNARRYRFSIRSTDTGPDDRITPQAMASLIQEAASLDAAVLGAGSGQLDSKGIVWVLIRHSLRFYDKPRWRDEIFIDTWTNGVSGIYALREFSISSSEGNVLAAASTSWILLDRSTKKPVRISVLGDERMERPDHSVLGSEAKRIRLGSDFAFDIPVMEQKINESDIDRNEHVNNTRYISWCYDVTGACGEEPLNITGFDINYLSEAVKGDSIEFFSCCRRSFPDQSESDCPSILIAGRHGSGGKICFTANIYL